MSDLPKLHEFCWNELATPDTQASKEFYGKVFGWEFVDHDMGEMTYTMIKHKNNEFAGMWQIPKDKEKQIPPHWMAYILVENLENALQNAEKHGANVIKPAENAGDFGRFAIITDPTGAYVALWQTFKKK